MRIGNHTWACATCGQGFTRKSSGLRHIKSLHLGKAMLVRPYEYIAAIVSGRFQQSHPSLYRRSTKKPPGYMTSFNAHSSAQLSSPLNKIVHEGMTPYATSHQTKPSSGTSEKNVGQSSNTVPLYKQPGSLNSAQSVLKMSQRIQKLKEIEKLAPAICKLNVATGIIMTALFQAAVLEDDASLDKTLEQLRQRAGYQRY